MADVFVSYARPDRDRVKSLVVLLEDRGWSVWWDRDIVPGEKFERLIDDEIQAARCVVAVWTPHSVDSEWVQAEAGDGLDRGILVPVMFDEVRVSVAFRRTDAADLVGWPRLRNQAEVDRFLSGVAQCIDHEPAPKHDYREPPKANWLRLGLVALLVAVLIAAFNMRWINRQFTPTEGETVTVTVQPFTDASGRDLGLEYELERRLKASPGLAARVTEDGVGDADYLIRAKLLGDVLTLELIDRNSVAIFSRTFPITDDLAELADALSRDLLVRLGRAADVVSRFAVDVPPGAFRAYLAANRLLRQSISLDILAEAERTYLDVLHQAPRFAAAHAGLCRTYLWLYVETRTSAYVSNAEQHCHRALTLDDQDSTVHVALGMLYRETGSMSRSVDSYRRALELAPHSADAMRGLGETLTRTGAQEKAEGWLRDAIAHEPNYWENYHALGSILFEAGSFEQANDAFLSALALAPMESRVLNNLGAVSFLTNNFDRAILYWRQAVEAQPSAFTLMNLGSAYFYLRDYEAAANMYVEAREFSPEDHMVWGHVGDALYAGGIEGFEVSYRRAIELATNQLIIDPKDRWTLSSLGAYHAALGEKERALAFVRQSVGVDDLDVVYDVAVSYARLGDVENAQAQLDTLVSLGYPTELIARDANFDGVPFPTTQQR